MGMSDLNFEKSLAELENIVQKLEKGDLSLEESLSLYKQGAELSLNCQKQLDEAKIMITEVNGGKND